MIQLFGRWVCLVAVELGGSCEIEVAQGVDELEVYKLTQKSGVYSVRAINKHRYREGQMISQKISICSFTPIKGLCGTCSYSSAVSCLCVCI